MKRLLDIIFSFLGLLILTPIGIIVAFLIKIDSKGPVFFNQTRIGLNRNPFQMHKFRTMDIDSDKKGQLTVGTKDPRITKVGYWLRKFKLDELPQLWNVLVGEMSLVGPRPEVRKYVDLYNEEEKKVLSVVPGITDWASIKFRNENKLIKNAANPEEFYIKNVMPAKLKMNLECVRNKGLWIDLKIILLTLFPFLGSRTSRKLASKIEQNLAASDS